jgi:single-stranded DNA-specific DHH superfamily exonuclease
MNRLDKAADLIARSLLQCDSMRVISHNDADGITSAGLMCNALARASIPFHATLVPRLDEQVISSVKDPVVFCDMGSGQPELISQVKGDVFVLDHHRPVGTLDCKHLNPHHFGIDGAFELSASGTVYSVVRKMGDNGDLASLAIAGALGDRQAMIGANRSLLEEALRSGSVEVRPGLKMEDGPLDEVLEGSLDPLLDITGDSIKVRAFLDEVGVMGEVETLQGESLSRLCTALVLKLLMQGSFAADSVVGEAIRAKYEVVKNLHEMVTMLNACGKLDKPGLGLTLCLRDDRALEECRKVTREYKRSILSGLEVLKSQLKELNHIRYLLTKDLTAGGVVAGLGIRYLYPDRPLVVLNEKEGAVRISARGSKALVRRGLDLSSAMRRAAEAVGGGGGGHNVASGATIPAGTEERFLAEVDKIVGTQLSNSKAME